MTIFKKMKLKQRFLLNILTMVVLVMVSLIGVISYNVRKVTMEESQKLVKEITKTEAAKIDNIIENSINVTSSLATIFGNMRLFNQSTRESLISMLYSTLQNNNELLGVWSIWEKDALDSRDMEYVNKPGHDIVLVGLLLIIIEIMVLLFWTHVLIIKQITKMVLTTLNLLNQVE